MPSDGRGARRTETRANETASRRSGIRTPQELDHVRPVRATPDSSGACHPGVPLMFYRGMP